MVQNLKRNLVLCHLHFAFFSVFHWFLLCIAGLFHYIKQAVRVATQYAPASSPPASTSRRNIAVHSHAKYVPTLTAAAALRVKTALSKAAWWPWPLTFDLLTLKMVSESRVTWTITMPILVFLGLSVLELRPMYATDRRQMSDRCQTDVRQKHRLMPLPIRGGGIIINLFLIHQYNCHRFLSFSCFYLFCN